MLANLPVATYSLFILYMEEMDHYHDILLIIHRSLFMMTQAGENYTKKHRWAQTDRYKHILN